MDTTEATTTESDAPTTAQAAFNAAAITFSKTPHDAAHAAIFEAANAAFNRAEEVLDVLYASDNGLTTLFSSLSERLDAVAKESAGNQIELRLHAQALDGQSTRLASAERQIYELDQALSNLEPCPEVAGTLEPLIGHTATPSIRVRISHAHTKSDGWRCDSTTVEYDGPIDQYDEEVMRAQLQNAHHLGAREAALRNAPQPPVIDAEAGE